MKQEHEAGWPRSRPWNIYIYLHDTQRAGEIILTKETNCPYVTTKKTQQYATNAHSQLSAFDVQLAIGYVITINGEQECVLVFDNNKHIGAIVQFRTMSTHYGLVTTYGGIDLGQH